MNGVKLNLARKWRSKQFEEIVGQELSVRMLKNSLYLQQYFPVYLFSGQRGCGKTTTARVFAASLNCEQLEKFQEKPQEHRVPCLQCASCKAMEQGSHPDFIEIDAASHTGVDNVRTLIESASLLPLMGRKKVYLIDEAHMLSKAAFNALLKILEEPPATVIFILATTDPQKIIDTVHSRCFQLFFRPIDLELLHARLREVCQKEQISYDDAGLALIARQTDGSARDALNLLEQVRFSSKSVTEQAVLQLLGHVDDTQLIELLSAVISYAPGDLLKTIEKLDWRRYSADIIWVRLLELIRASLWLKYGVAPDAFEQHHERLRKMVKDCSAHQLIRFLQVMYDQELLFAKTTAKHDFLEMILLQLCQFIKRSGSNGGSSSSSVVAAPMAMQDDSFEDEELEEQEEDEEDEEEYEETMPDTVDGKWQRFISELRHLDDPIIQSIFSQAVTKNFDQEAHSLVVNFSKQFIFFEQMIDRTKNNWLPFLQKFFGPAVVLKSSFTAEPPQKESVQKTVEPVQEISAQTEKTLPTPPRKAVAEQPKKQPYGPRRFNSSQVFKPFAQEASIDISDESVFPNVHKVLRHIPGTVTEIRDIQ